MAFKLSSNDSTFNNRVDALFNSLEEVSKSSTDNKIAATSSDIDKVSSIDKQFVFKKPYSSPKPRGIKRRHTEDARQNFTGRIRGSPKSAPDYEKNPEKWTYYSLEDTECHGNSQNRAIAAELFSSIKNNSDLPYNDEGNGSTSTKIHFKKPTQDNLKNKMQTTLRKSDRNFILPSYEVGQSKSQKKKSCNISQAKTEGKKLDSTCKTNRNEVKLSYLEEEEEDNDD